MAGASLPEAEIVTADGAVRIANARTNPKLFWALKGGGNGGFGVVTRLTVRTSELPQFNGGAFGTIKAQSDTAFRRPIELYTEFYATRLFVALHCNKGLAGGAPKALAEARETAMNPAVTEAFALAIIAHGGPPAYPGMPGPGPDLAVAHRNAAAIGKAIGVLRELVPDAGSYVSEAGYNDPDWRSRSFGPNHLRLLAVKPRSEDWSPDGFTRI